MNKKTDMQKIKEISKGLLRINILETDFSPMIVSHPFTKSGIVMLKDGDDFVHADITKDDLALAKWQSEMAWHIDRSPDVYQIYSMVNDAYALAFFQDIANHLSQEDFSRLLADVWVNSEYANSDANVNKNTILNFFKKADKKYLMTESEYDTLSNLGDVVTIYRGVTPRNKRNIKALSWTLSRSKARWFANRFGQGGEVYSATIDKSNIYAYFDSRNEAEVIVDPKHLKNISRISQLNSSNNDINIR